MQVVGQFRGAGAQGDEVDAAGVELGELGWVVTLESKISSFGSWPDTVRQWSAKARTSLFWPALDRCIGPQDGAAGLSSSRLCRRLRILLVNSGRWG